MNHPWIALAVLAFTPFTGQKSVEIDVDVKEGDIVSTDRKFVVRVKSKNPVTSVEFYVDDELRSSDSSTPYEFEFDALSENEGDVKLKFTAFANDGESATKLITIKVDNGVSKGADFHVQQAGELLAVSKWDEAIRVSRVALKAKPGYNPARLTIARAYMGKGVLDQAQKYAEDAINADPNYLEAADLLSGINLKRAFSTYHRGGEQRETLATISTALKSAVKNRNRILQNSLDKVGPPTAANLTQYADAAIRAGRYSAAISALLPTFRSDSRRNDVANRLAYAQLRGGRFNDAHATLTEHARQGTLDAFGWALSAVLKTHAGDFVGADDAMRQAVLSDSEDLGVRTAQAFVAIARGRTQTLRQLATGLAKDEGQRSDVNYYLSTLYGLVGDYAASRDAFERSVLAEPANADMYVQRANESLKMVASGKLDTGQNAYHVLAARAFYETALEARPEFAEALTGIALINMMDKKTTDALRYARGAVAASPGYAAGHYTLSLVTSQLEADLRAAGEKIIREPKDGVLTSDQRAQSQKLFDEANKYGKESKVASDMAGKLDPPNLQGREIPKGLVAYEYFAKYGRIPLIAAPK